MRITHSLFLVPTLCFALGAEQVEFFGFGDNAELVQLSFKEDPQDWSGRNFIYGTSESGALSFCWTTRVNEVPIQFLCTSSKGNKPTLIYEALPISDQGAHPPKGTPYEAEYKKLARKAKLGTGKKRGNGTVLAIYECTHRCSPGVPQRLYKVGRFD